MSTRNPRNGFLAVDAGKPSHASGAAGIASGKDGSGIARQGLPTRPDLPGMTNARGCPWGSVPHRVGPGPRSCRRDGVGPHGAAGLICACTCPWRCGNGHGAGFSADSNSLLSNATDTDFSLTGGSGPVAFNGTITDDLGQLVDVAGSVERG